MRILITGGSGFLGQYLLKELLKTKNEIIVIDKNKIFFEKKITFFNEDINNDKLLEKIFKRKIDYVFHFAALADINLSSLQPENTVIDNILTTVKLLKYSSKFKIKRFFLASTVYVHSNEGSFYKSSKIAAESYVQEFYKKHKLKFTILRFGSLYGPQSDITNGLYRIIERALRDKQITYEGDSESMREFIHVKDAAKSCLETMKKEYENKNVLITGNQNIKIKDLLKIISEILNLNKKIKFVKNKNEGHYTRTPYNYLLNSEYKYTPKLSIELGYGIMQLTEFIKNKNKLRNSEKKYKNKFL